MKTIASRSRQSLFDVALLAYGRAELAFDIALANGLCLSDIPGEGAQLLIPAPDGGDDPAVADFYALNGVSPATAPEESTLAGLNPEGIGYWAIYAPAPVFTVSPD